MVKRLLSIILILSLALSNVVITYGDTTSAKVTELSGVVKVKRSGSTKEFDAFVNMTIGEGDKIRTGTGGTVTLLVDGENEVVAGKNTSFTITDLSEVASEPSSAYTIHYGSVTNDVNKKGFAKNSYKVNTTNTVMGVRGTVFEVAKKISQDGNEAVTLVTLDGSVVVSNRAIGEDGTSALNEIGAVTAGQQIIFSNEDENTGEVVVLDITKLDAETLSWLLENVEYLSTEQKATAETTLVEALKVETEKAKEIEKTIETYTDESNKTVVMVEKKTNNNQNNGNNSEVTPDIDETDDGDEIEVEVPGGDNTGTEGGDNGDGGDNTGTEGGDNGNGGDNTGTVVVPDPDYNYDPTRVNYEINSVEEFVLLNEMINTSGSAVVGTVNINTDLNLKDVSNWKPVNLKGVIIKGNGNTISNLTINETDVELNTGLFASIENSLINDLNLENITIDGTDVVKAGALAGTVKNSFINDIAVTNSTIVGDCVGGVVGNSEVVALTNIYVGNTTLVGNTVGGIVGSLNYSTIVNGNVSEITVELPPAVKAESVLGGIAGYSYSAGIVNCKVSNNKLLYTVGTTGGIVGVADFTNIESVIVDVYPGIEANSTVGGVVGKGKNVSINKANVEVFYFLAYIYEGAIIGEAQGATNINNSRAVVDNGLSLFNVNSRGIVGASTNATVGESNNTSIADTISVIIHSQYTCYTAHKDENYVFNNTYYHAIGTIGDSTIDDVVDTTGLKRQTLEELLALNWDTNIWNIETGKIPTLK